MRVDDVGTNDEAENFQAQLKSKHRLQRSVHFFIPTTSSLFNMTARRPKTGTVSHKSSSSRNRLMKLRSQVGTTSTRSLVPNGQYSEAGFRDVRTNFEKDRLLQWVKSHPNSINLSRQMLIM